VKICIWGAGSIGSKHFRILKELGAEVCFLSRRKLEDKFYNSLEEVLTHFDPDHFIIASETNDHKKYLKMIIDKKFKGNIFIEKPIFNTSLDIDFIENEFKDRIFVLYNIRYNKGLNLLKSYIDSEGIVGLTCFVGQFLPDWRKGSDYRTSYSASLEKGGGVVRDLSHEIDYTSLLAGNITGLFSLTGNCSNLEITSEDFSNILMQSNTTSNITIGLNYLNRSARRFILLNTSSNTYELDLVKNELLKNGELIKIEFNMAESYELQAKAIFEKDYSLMCTYEQGIKTLKIIEAIKISSKDKRFISL
jgi:predicted dehydrogenase